MSDASGRPPLLLFDGVCNLCHRAVRWVLKRDRQKLFRFASLQSRAGKLAIKETGHHGPTPDSVVVIDQGKIYERSDAALRIARLLGFPWALFLALWVIPRPIRDAIYRWIARHRYRWFGKKSACPTPPPDAITRFLDANESPTSKS
ncbi:MAG: thiol-disulfide oxidoreductase DCC family protein [Planctomycetes bacterium]|nr:thiol-disulfide oxidoreductase DCC family protein [Planctomycetota bacterium]